MKQYHPICNFIYFAAVIGFAMFLNHPVFVAISMAGGIAYTLQLFGIRKSGKGFCCLFFFMLLTAVINPAFSHQGVTALAVLPTGNVLTLESVLYGVGLACKLAAVLLWFRCAGEILTTDKIQYLFGKTFPALGLVLSMIFAFIPKMQKKSRELSLAGGNVKGVRQALDRLGMLITWMLEDAAVQADSMKGRGYGLGDRTFFIIFRFTGRDKRMLVYLCMVLLLMIMAVFAGCTEWYYYPEIDEIKAGGFSVFFYILYALLCAVPVVMEKCEEIKWNRLQSAI